MPSRNCSSDGSRNRSGCRWSGARSRNSGRLSASPLTKLFSARASSASSLLRYLASATGRCSMPHVRWKRPLPMAMLRLFAAPCRRWKQPCAHKRLQPQRQPRHWPDRMLPLQFRPLGRTMRLIGVYPPLRRKTQARMPLPVNKRRLPRPCVQHHGRWWPCAAMTAPAHVLRHCLGTSAARAASRTPGAALVMVRGNHAATIATPGTTSAKPNGRHA